MKDSETLYGFVHIPKTGGTSIIKFFNDNYPDRFVCSRLPNKPYHSLTTRDIENPILVVRCPFERFLSSYNYWKNGPKNGPYKEIFYNNHKTLSIDQFIDAIKIDKTIYNTRVTWGVHFKPQTFWIKKEDYHKCIIIKYETNLQKKINTLIRLLNLGQPQSELLYINSTNKSDILTEYAKEYVKDYYRADFDFLEQIDRCNCFKAVI